LYDGDTRETRGLQYCWMKISKLVAKLCIDMLRWREVNLCELEGFQLLVSGLLSDEIQTSMIKDQGIKLLLKWLEFVNPLQVRSKRPTSPPSPMVFHILFPSQQESLSQTIYQRLETYSSCVNPSSGTQAPADSSSRLPASPLAHPASDRKP